MEPITLHGIVVKKVVWTRPAKDDDDPKVSITLELSGDHLEDTKTLLDFAEAGPTNWTVSALERVMAMRNG